MTRMTRDVMREVDEGLCGCGWFVWCFCLFVVKGFRCALRIGLLFVCLLVCVVVVVVVVCSCFEYGVWGMGYGVCDCICFG